MKRCSVIAFTMLMSTGSIFALGTNAGEVITNGAKLSYSSGGVAQPDVETATDDSFVVDKKIDMILETNDANQIEVSPGQTGMITSFSFKNEGNANQSFKFSVANLATGANEADYDNDADNEDVSSMIIECTGGKPDPATSAANGTIIVAVDEDVTISCTVSATIPSAPGGADGDIMNIELLATAVDNAGANEVETAGADTQSGTPDIVFADGETIANGSTVGNLGTEGKDASSKGDTAGDGKETARSGYIIQTPIIALVKTSCVVSDPVNNTTNPKRIPGAIIRYMFDIENTGTGDVDDLDISDTIQAELDTSGTKASAKKKENQKSCECAKEPSDSASSDTTVAGQDVTIEKIDVLHGATQGKPGENHTCVSIETEIK